MSLASKDAYEVPGKLEIPYRYMAGKCGSRFLTALRDEKKILATRCPRCGTVFVPPRSVCDKCYQRIEEWREVGPGGVITSFTVIRYWEPYLPYPPPLVMAQVKLDGADTSLTHLLREVKPEEVKIGMRVEPVFAPERKARITDLAYFRPATLKEKAPKPVAPKKAKKKTKAEKKAPAKKARAPKLAGKKAPPKKGQAQKKGKKTPTAVARKGKKKK